MIRPAASLLPHNGDRIAATHLSRMVPEDRLGAMVPRPSRWRRQLAGR